MRRDDEEVGHAEEKRTMRPYHYYFIKTKQIFFFTTKKHLVIYIFIQELELKKKLYRVILSILC